MPRWPTRRFASHYRRLEFLSASGPAQQPAHGTERGFSRDKRAPRTGPYPQRDAVSGSMGNDVLTFLTFETFPGRRARGDFIHGTGTVYDRNGSFRDRVVPVRFLPTQDKVRTVRDRVSPNRAEISFFLSPKSAVIYVQGCHLCGTNEALFC